MHCDEPLEGDGDRHEDGRGDGDLGKKRNDHVAFKHPYLQGKLETKRPLFRIKMSTLEQYDCAYLEQNILELGGTPEVDELFLNFKLARKCGV